MASLECHLHLLQGRNLSVKDRVSSDPFVRIYLDDGTSTQARAATTFDGDGADCLFQSRSKSKTTNPKFNERFRHVIRDTNIVAKAASATQPPHFVLSIFDEDGMHGEDAMGRVYIPIALGRDGSTAKWYPVQHGGQGELQVKLQVEKVEG